MPAGNTASTPGAIALTDEQRHRLTLSKYPRSARYDAGWMLENMMGPNALWLLEALTQAMHLKKGMRVLDLGCGKAMTSIFLAREFDVQVWAADLWIAPADNLQRIDAAKLAERVFPLRLEARQLPFAAGYFDAVVSVDAYHYFGTDDLYFAQYLAPLLAPGGELGIVVPGLANEFTEVPAHLKPYWEPAFHTFHSADWWKRHIEHSARARVTKADRVSEGWRDWLTWQEICVETGTAAGRPDTAQREAEMLRVDGGRHLGFTRLVAKTPAA
jgi:cyclopropane fatty-acyl-phospholipid synthase-like methyltransferase